MTPIPSSHKSFLSKAPGCPCFPSISAWPLMQIPTCVSQFLVFAPYSSLCHQGTISLFKTKLLSGGTFLFFPSLSSHAFHWASSYVRFSSWNIITQLHGHTSELDPDNEFHLFLCLYHVETTPSLHFGKQQISKVRHVHGEGVPSRWTGAWEVVNST